MVTHSPGCPYNSQREGIIVSNFSGAWVPSLEIRPPAEREAKSPGRKIRTPWGNSGLKFCDVTCDVTLASMPLQVAANPCYESQVTSGQNRRRALCVCNLRLLLLIACWF